MQKIIIGLIMTVVFVFNVPSQTTDSKETGQQIVNDSTAKTTIIFKTKKSGDIVPISNQKSKLCDAPARIELDAGSYTFYADGKKININASGGSQVWEVKNGKPYLMYTGGFLGLLGVVLNVTGIVMATATGKDLYGNIVYPSESDKKDGLTLSLIGCGIMVSSPIVIVIGSPKAKLISHDNQVDQSFKKPFKTPINLSCTLAPTGIIIAF